MSEFRDAVLRGLRSPRKVIPARYFYDEAGSRLFEDITRLPEYYPTRTEIGILAEAAPSIAAAAGPGRAVVEFGSGSSEKTPPLLRALNASAYIPIDISPSALEGAAAMLAGAVPGMAVEPVEADFLGEWEIPAVADRRRLLGFFPGSTIGNMAPAAAVDLLRRFRERLGADAAFVIGIDARKDRAVLEAAYNDSGGVTAAFNMNLLVRMQDELGAELSLQDFRHRALWAEGEGRIEMHLEAVRDTAITVGEARFTLRAGESIHTENSYKYAPAEAALLARASGWEPVRMWTDAQQRFMVHLWRAGDGALQP